MLAHAGAAFVSKNEEPEYLLNTIAEVARGRMVFPYLDVRGINANPLAALTKRELEILSSLAAGRTNKEIAARKGVSTNTVKYHISPFLWVGFFLPIKPCFTPLMHSSGGEVCFYT